MKYAVAWVSLGARETVYEIYDTKEPINDVPYLHHNNRKTIFVSDLPKDRKIWNARLIIWVD